MSVDTIGDFLTIIRNGIMVSRPFVKVPFSKLKHQIADILKLEGFVHDVVVEGDSGPSKLLKITLKYVNGESVVHEISRKSRPSRRVYESHVALSPVVGGLGIAILSTNRGVMTNKRAKSLSLGGEVLCTVW